MKTNLRLALFGVALCIAAAIAIFIWLPARVRAIPSDEPHETEVAIAQTQPQSARQAMAPLTVSNLPAPEADSPTPIAPRPEIHSGVELIHHLRTEICACESANCWQEVSARYRPLTSLLDRANHEDTLEIAANMHEVFSCIERINAEARSD